VATALVSVLLIAFPAPSVGRSKPASERQRAEIIRVLERHGQAACIAQGICRIKVRISTENSRWAGVYIRPKQGYADQVQADAGSLFRRNHRWRIHQLGNGGGCDVPREVAEDLRLACY
jgi:hypothetical protein